MTVLAAIAVATAATTSGPAPDDAGGGAAPIAVLDDITLEQRSAIQAEIDANIQALPKAAPLAPLAAVTFAWPLQPVAGFSDYGYHGISNFVDQNLSYPNALLDFDCGARTYDLASGYNHGGTDIFTWPFGWKKMDDGDITIVAAAAGTIVSKTDGNFDRSCGLNSNPWNAVYVKHADDSVAWYGHMKSGSTTSKGVGDTVAQGEYLGLVGSSGSSTGPHLHFEVHGPGGGLIDPFDGPCNALNPSVSWWQAQPPYYDSALNDITTGTAPPTFPSCGTAESPNASDFFLPGSTIVFTTYYRDQRSSQVGQHSIHRPDGSVYASWTLTSDQPYYPASYWWRTYTFGTGEPTGTYRYEVVFDGDTYAREFRIDTVACTAESCDDGDACTVDTCDPNVGCSRSPAGGVVGIGCLCDDVPPQCTGQTIVSKVQKNLARACATLAGVDAAPSPAKRHKLVRSAIKRLNKAAKAAAVSSRGRRAKLSGACGVGLRALIADIVALARTL
jgi:murein DD-endopeptidase MepM/ murein hydrolase activator NlpD